MSEKTIVVTTRDKHDVYIGRPSKWGNPFCIGFDGDRATVIEKYQDWLLNGNPHGRQKATEEARQWILGHVHELRGKRLGCYCAPLPCHGDVLAQLAKEATP